MKKKKKRPPKMNQKLQPHRKPPHSLNRLMSTLRNQAQTVHKGARPLDFLSHKVKSGILPSQQVDVDLGLPIPTSRPLKFTKQPIHPWLRPTPVQRLSGAIGKLKSFYRFSPYEITDKDGQVKYHSRFHDVDSTEEALSYLNKHTVFKELHHVERTFVRNSIENIDTLAASKLQDKFGTKSFQILLDDQFFNQDGVQIDLESKVRFLIKKNIETQPVITYFFMIHYIENIQHQRSSRDIFLYYLQSIRETGCQFAPKSIYRALTENIANSYPSLVTDPEIIESVIDILSRSGKKIYRQKELLLALEELGYVPSVDVIERFLEAAVGKLGKKSPNSSIIQFLKGLDNVLYSSLSPKVAQILTQQMNSSEEVTSFIQIIDSKPNSGDIYQSIKDDLISLILRGKLDIALSVTLIQKLESITPLSHDSYYQILKNVAKKGSLIYASTLVQRHEFSKAEKTELLKILGNRRMSGSFKPGFDVGAKTHLETLLGE